MHRIVLQSGLALCIFGTLSAQEPSSNASQPQTNASQSTEKPRVFVTDSESWEVQGSTGGSNGAFAASETGGARPQTAEIIKTFGERCSEVVINNRQNVADYIVVLDHEGGKGYLRHRNKVAVFEHLSGDVVISHSTLSLGGSVEDACNGIVQHWAAHSKELLAAREKSQSAPTPSASATVAAAAPVQVNQQASLTVDSNPAGADIEIDGGFVGETPSTVLITSGGHEITVEKKGFVTWTRKLNVTGGNIRLNAELEQHQAQ